MLSDLQKTKLIPEAIEAYFKKECMDGAKLGRLAKVGESIMNHIINGKTKINNNSKQGFTQINDKYYVAVCETIGYKLEDKKKWRHFNTHNFKAITNQIKAIREEKTRGTIDGDTGMGKSYGCEGYQKIYPLNTFLVKCDPVENSKEFAKSLAEIVKVETHGTSGAIVKRVCNKLLGINESTPLLIIDEAEHIKTKSGYINIVKSLADRLENKVPIVLCGMDINEILQTASDKHKQNFRQSARRFSKRMKCFEDISEDIVKISQEFKFSDACTKWLVNRIKNFGELEVIITDALKESEKSQKPITIELLNSLYQ